MSKPHPARDKLRPLPLVQIHPLMSTEIRDLKFQEYWDAQSKTGKHRGEAKSAWDACWDMTHQQPEEKPRKGSCSFTVTDEIGRTITLTLL